MVWLGGLHVPESYIAALVQTVCRARGWPLDKAALSSTVGCATPVATGHAEVSDRKLPDKV